MLFGLPELRVLTTPAASETCNPSDRRDRRTARRCPGRIWLIADELGDGTAGAWPVRRLLREQRQASPFSSGKPESRRVSDFREIRTEHPHIKVAPSDERHEGKN